MKKVFTLVLNWNNPKDTLECVDSLLNLDESGIDNKIAIIDNGSSDNSIELFEKIIKKHPKKIMLLTTGKNLGYTGGNNFAVKKLLKQKPSYFLIVNNDIVVEKKMLINMIASAEKYSKVAIVSPKIYFEKGFEFHKDRYKSTDLGKVFWSAGGYIDWDNVFGVNDGLDEVDKGQFDKEELIDFATGACILINTSSIKKRTLFDNKYYLYFEDVDLSTRLKKSGWKIIYSPNSICWHKVSRSSAIGSQLNDYFIARNRMYFGLKYAPIKTKLALIKESARLLVKGRFWQRTGIKDYYLGLFGKGSWKQ